MSPQQQARGHRSRRGPFIVTVAAAAAVTAVADQIGQVTVRLGG